MYIHLQTGGMQQQTIGLRKEMQVNTANEQEP